MGNDKINDTAEVVFQENDEKNIDTAIVAGGCFWGVEHYMKLIPGVVSTDVGYIDGIGDNPTYRQVCTNTTGYAEAVRIRFDRSKTTYENVLKMFFEIHDPTQLNHQGPDVGLQYRSAVYYLDEAQKSVAMKLVDILKAKGYDVVTEIKPAVVFWPAEDYHQDYYDKTGKQPYCHGYTKRF